MFVYCHCSNNNKKTEEELDMCMIKVQKSKTDKNYSLRRQTDRQTDIQMKLRSNTHGCELIIKVIKFGDKIFNRTKIINKNLKGEVILPPPPPKKKKKK